MPRSYAHLLGFGRPAAVAVRAENESDDDRKKREDDEKARKAKKAEDDKKDKEETAEEEEEDTEASVEDDADPDETEDERKKREDDEAKKAKKAKSRASDGDDEDEQDEADSKSRAVRGRERARCAAIFGSPHAAANIVGACHIAFGTSLPRSQAISMLAALGGAASAAAAPKSDALRDRMPKEPSANVGSSGGAAAAPTLAAQIVAAHRKATGEAA